MSPIQSNRAYTITKSDLEKRRIEIVLAGMGGQGLVTAGSILARAMILYDKKNATQSQNYGPESRGGLSISEVIISDGDIDYPKVIADPQVLVTLSNEAFQHFKKNMPGVTHLIVDPEIIKDIDQAKVLFPKVKVHKISVIREAEKLGNKVVGNILVLGVIAGILGLNPESIKQAIQVQFKAKQKVIPINLRAIDRGIELSKS